MIPGKEIGVVKQALAALIVLWAGVAVAQESKIEIELNRVAERDGICQVYFRVKNRTETPFSGFKVDLAFFDKNGVINDRVLVDLAPLRSQKTSIHVFDMPDLDCANIGEVLLNDITECQATDGANSPGDCFGAVKLTAKGGLDFYR